MIYFGGCSLFHQLQHDFSCWPFLSVFLHGNQIKSTLKVYCLQFEFFPFETVVSDILISITVLELVSR